MAPQQDRERTNLYSHDSYNSHRNRVMNCGHGDNSSSKMLNMVKDTEPYSI